MSEELVRQNATVPGDRVEAKAELRDPDIAFTDGAPDNIIVLAIFIRDADTGCQEVRSVAWGCCDWLPVYMRHATGLFCSKLERVIWVACRAPVVQPDALPSREGGAPAAIPKILPDRAAPAKNIEHHCAAFISFLTALVPTILCAHITCQ